jgi:hypothetical protein
MYAFIPLVFFLNLKVETHEYQYLVREVREVSCTNNIISTENVGRGWGLLNEKRTNWFWELKSPTKNAAMYHMAQKEINNGKHFLH